jgi:hypothetical protein
MQRETWCFFVVARTTDAAEAIAGSTTPRSAMIVQGKLSRTASWPAKKGKEIRKGNMSPHKAKREWHVCYGQ